MCIHSVWAWLQAYRRTKTYEYKSKRLPSGMVGSHIFLLENQSKGKRGSAGASSRSILLVEYGAPVDTTSLQGPSRARVCREELGWSTEYYLAYPVVRMRVLRWGLVLTWRQFPHRLGGIEEGDARAALTQSISPAGHVFEIAAEVELRASLTLFIAREKKRAAARVKSARMFKVACTEEDKGKARKYLTNHIRCHYIPTTVQLAFIRNLLL